MHIAHIQKPAGAVPRGLRRIGILGVLGIHGRTVGADTAVPNRIWNEVKLSSTVLTPKRLSFM